MKKLCMLVFLLIAVKSYSQDAGSGLLIPLGGNAWAHEGNAEITNNGIEHWTDSKSLINIYFRAQEAGKIGLALRLKVPDGVSTIRITAGKQILTKTVNNHDFETISFGDITIDKPGYVKVILQGLNKTGATFAEVSELVLLNVPASSVYYVKNNEGNFFHWGRRGSSVHLRYVVPAEAKTQAEWFYNEITVPTGMDKIGSYFMADGFSFGYFGMQVNSETERRVLFSVWSPTQTDDPKSIPENMRIQLLKKGDNVNTGEFGNEGSGGQSYLKYTWQAGKTYAFLLHAQPDSVTKTTIFTAYFKDKSEQQWHLIASFKRPVTNTCLKDLYSFVENFIPDNGEQQREARFGNQWVCTMQGKWYSLNEATFTADNTAKQNYRLDYGGGITGNYFYLHNGGFADETTPVKQNFKRQVTEPEPKIDLNKLP